VAWERVDSGSHKQRRMKKKREDPIQLERGRKSFFETNKSKTYAPGETLDKEGNDPRRGRPVSDKNPNG